MEPSPTPSESQYPFIKREPIVTREKFIEYQMLSSIGRLPEPRARDPEELPALRRLAAELKDRIAKTIDFLKGLKADQLDGREDAQVTITQGGQPRNFRAQVYLYHLAMPNFYFHTTTAYNILRSLGIEIGKRDFMGQMPS